MKNPFSSDKNEENLKEEIKIDEEKTADENAETENEVCSSKLVAQYGL